VRRILSVSLLLLFSLPLISPLFAADAAELSLPACCRRDGKHHCTMVRKNSNDGSGLQADAMRERCPCVPVAPVTTRIEFFPGADRATLRAEAVSDPAGAVQTEVRRCVLFDRSRQKRGPPFRQA
jgi:hypothetical protein